MTNELLAQLISEGNNDELIPLLWEKTRKWFGSLAAKYVRAYGDRCAQYGVTAEDIKQEGYFVLLEALEKYKVRPEEHKDEKFLNFCHFPYKQHVAKMLGTKAVKGSAKFDAHTNAKLSLDDQVADSTNSDFDYGALLDMLPDESALEQIEDEYNKTIAEDDTQLVKIILGSVLKIDREREVIKRLYINNDTLVSVAESFGWSTKRVRTLRDRAIKRIKADKYISSYGSIRSMYRGAGFLSFTRNQCSIVERIVEQREAEAQRKKVLGDIISFYEAHENCEQTYDDCGRNDPDYVWVYDESRVKKTSNNLDTELIIKLIREDPSITVGDIRKELQTQYGKACVWKTISNLGYVKKRREAENEDRKIVGREWKYTPGTRRKLGTNRKYELDVERIDKALKECPTMKVKDLKEILGTEMSVVQLTQTLRALGYTSVYVYK